MAVTGDGSPRPVKGRMTFGVSSRKRRLSKARSSISGDSWDQTSLPLSLRQPAFIKGSKTPTATTARHSQKMRLSRPAIEPGSSRVILAFNQSSEQVRPFDAFVDAPSPFAKQRRQEKKEMKESKEERELLARTHGYPRPRTTINNIDSTTTTNKQDFDNTFNSIPLPRHTSSSLPPYIFPDSFLHHHPYYPSHNSFMSGTQLTQPSNMNSNRMLQTTEGYLDARTRSANLQHTRPEWTTWDFVDLFLSGLPPRIRTVDLWKNFRKEGEVDLIDIFVTRSGQKDNKARMRFR